MPRSVFMFSSLTHLFEGALIGLVVDYEGRGIARAVGLLPEEPGPEGGTPAHTGTSSPRMARSRSFISPAALLVKVRHRISRGGHALADEVGHPVDDDPGLAGARAREDQERALGVLHRALLLGVEAFEDPALHALSSRTLSPSLRALLTSSPGRGTKEVFRENTSLGLMARPACLHKGAGQGERLGAAAGGEPLRLHALHEGVALRIRSCRPHAQ